MDSILVTLSGSETGFSSSSLLKLTSLKGTASYVDWLSSILMYENIQAIGLVLYSYYGFSFVLSSLILLVAMMGSIILTLKESATTKRQDIFKQTQSDFIKTINMR